MENFDIINDYVARKIKDIYLLVNIKENTLFEIDEQAYIIFGMLKSNNGLIDYDKISSQLELNVEKTKEIINAFLRALSE